jgi:hypothetical protein
MEAHREGLSMVARPGRRLMAVVAVLEGRRRRQRGCRGTGAGAKLVVAKPGADGGRRWWPMWRWFPDGEGDGSLTDGGSRISSRWPSGAGSRNKGGGVEGVLKWWQCATIDISISIAVLPMNRY